MAAGAGRQNGFGEPQNLRAKMETLETVLADAAKSGFMDCPRTAALSEFDS